MFPLSLGFDESTQSLTVSVINNETRANVCAASVSFDEFEQTYGTTHGVKRKQESAPRSGERVWGYPLMWLEALDKLFHKLTEPLRAQGYSFDQIGAISGSGQQHAVVWLNANAPARLDNLSSASSLKDGLADIFSLDQSYVWMDSSTAREVEEIEQACGGRARLQKAVGNIGYRRFSGSQIRRVFKEQKSAYEKTQHICLVSSFMASVLAGQIMSLDCGDAAGTNLMDIQSRQWHPQALDATAPDLASKLPSIQPTDTPGVPISPYFCKTFGFSPKCQVCLWTGDNPASLIGLGLIRGGAMAVSLGTSDTVFTVMDEFQLAEGQGCVLVSPAGPYMGLICFANGGLTRQRIRDQFGHTWGEFESLLAGSRPGNFEVDPGGNRGPFRILLPYFIPEITPPVPGSLAVYHQLSPTDAVGCVRGVVEARALAAKIHSAWAAEQFTALRLTGGGAGNTEIVRIFANVFNLPAQRLATTNAAALGAALIAARVQHKQDWDDVVADFTQPESTIDPDPDAVEIYKEMLEEYRAVEARHTP